ncbi:glycosyltransferase [Tissierella carlieri]|jgi:glycosyltransferase involved in cell wall biosynthesis|uniref:glycosyltransferase n=1 Tax=Tissierella carlieri TaxID=689904 RepID=UPI0028064211|nr:glycosyltransferase [uncultured Tissierella sp.]MDU5080372.1 glycosyltransferase [Bacillota bacterium]
MEKVLIIANEFPPMGGAGVQRTTKFVKYLPKFGYEPVVITKEHVADLTDKTLLEDLPKNLKVYRLKPYDTVNKKGILRLPFKFLGTRILSPDSEFFWYYFNRDKIVEIIKKENINIIYTTSFPYSSHLMGLYIKRLFSNIRWITDFRDEWTNNPYHLDSWYKKIKLNLEKKKELEVTNECDFLITNTPFMLDNFIKDNPSLVGRSTYIPNGYDEEDFVGLNNARDGGDKFVITYTGSLYGRRNLTEFLDGLKIAIDNKKIDKGKLEIRVVGNIYQEVLDEYAKKYDLVDSMKSFGYLPHKESIQMLYNSDILLLVIGKGKGSKNFYTGKIFEYIRVDRPILSIVPEDGAAAQVINETNTGTVVDPEDIDGISVALEKYYKSWTEGKLTHEPNWDKIQVYSRESQAKRLSEIFKESKDI